MFLYKPKRPVLAFLFPYYLFFYKPNTISVVCEYRLSGIVCASACPYLCTVIIKKGEMIMIARKMKRMC